MANSLDEQHRAVDSWRADADIAANVFVKRDATERDVVTCGSGEKALGVSAYPVSNGEAIAVVRDGKVAVTCAEAIPINSAVGSDGSGKAMVAESGNYILGIAETATTVADALVLVDLQRGGEKVS